MELDANVNFWQIFPDLILLMVQKSGNHHLGYTKPCKSLESNYQPQLVILPDFSYQQYYYHDVKHIPTHRIHVWYIYLLCICLIFYGKWWLVGLASFNDLLHQEVIAEAKGGAVLHLCKKLESNRDMRLREFLLGGYSSTRTIHVCYLFTYMYHKSQPFMQVKIQWLRRCFLGMGFRHWN